MLSSTAHPPSEAALCCYVNATAHTEIVRITNIPHWYFERVVFPGQRLIFEAPAIAKLEIHTGMAISSILSETIDCQELQLTSSSAASDSLA
ncbi:DUF1830 domain-containing protein [Pleurocapsa sp. FMAR1]|uniref:DUF1830 domain-containing protein n=1 Tax=Pleurocapsa sp. FMAR1 TaxID=3040204 RepID=UPI0029C684D7|nr:DUF1830 domain-containing protein [Pleurocapsa sp. FMAR1]